MSICMACGGKRENNILRHKPTCAFYVQTKKAADEAAANDARRAEQERLDALVQSDEVLSHPDLVELGRKFDEWYPAE